MLCTHRRSAELLGRGTFGERGAGGERRGQFGSGRRGKKRGKKENLLSKIIVAGGIVEYTT